MRKMIKRFVTTAMLVTSMVVTTMVVNAASKTDQIESPSGKTGQWASGGWVSLYKNADTYNADDLLREGAGTIINRKVTKLTMNSSAATSASVDGTGENGAELYLSMKIAACQNDPSDPIYGSGLFKYILYIELD